MTLMYSTLAVVVVAVVMTMTITITMVDGGYSMSQSVTRSHAGTSDGSYDSDGTATVKKDENVQASSKTDGYVKYDPKTCKTARDCGDVNNPRYFCVAFRDGNICKRPSTRGKFCSPNPDDTEKMIYKWYPPCNQRTRPRLTCAEVRQNPSAWGCIPAPKTKKPKKTQQKRVWF